MKTIISKYLWKFLGETHIKRKIRKILVIAVSLCMILSLAASVYADTDLKNEVRKENRVFIENELAKGGISISSGLETEVKSIEGEKAIIVAKPDTQIGELTVLDSDVAINKKGDAFIEVCDNTYVEANYDTVNLNNQEEVDSFIISYSLEKDELEELKMYSELAQDNNESNASLTIYETVKGFTYNGHEMKTKLKTYSNISTPTRTIYKGKRTKEEAKLLKNIYLSGIIFDSDAAVTEYMPYISVGVAIFDYFLEKYKESLVPGSTEDFCEIYMSFDRYDKRVFVKDNVGVWHHTLDAEYVKILKTSTRQYYYNKSKTRGYERTKVRTQNKVIKTPSYDSPYKNALKAFNSNFRNEYITYRVGKLTFTFGV